MYSIKTNEHLLVCKYFKIDPLKLISSGSMLITCENANELIEKLKEKNIKATIIGNVNQSNDKVLLREGSALIIEEPSSDELYKVV